MTIYVDIVLLENLLMNYIILFTTGMIARTKTSTIKLVFSGGVGGVYAVISFMNILEIYSSITLKILLSVVMIYIAFKPNKIKTLCKQLVLFYLVSFAFGGTAFALLYFVRPQDILMKNGLFIGTYPLKIAFLGAIVGFIILQTALKSIKTRFHKKDMFCEIEIEIEGNTQKAIAMIDTGNLLKEPITGMPVIVVEQEKIEKLIPEMIHHAEEIIQGNTQMLKDSEITRLRVIPFQSLGKENGLLLGIKPDRIFIRLEEEEKQEKEAMIGLYPKKLTKNGAYQALMGLELLERRTNEHIADVKV